MERVNIQEFISYSRDRGLADDEIKSKMNEMTASGVEFVDKSLPGIPKTNENLYASPDQVFEGARGDFDSLNSGQLVHETQLIDHYTRLDGVSYDVNSIKPRLKVEFPSAFTENNEAIIDDTMRKTYTPLFMEQTSSLDLLNTFYDREVPEGSEAVTPLWMRKGVRSAAGMVEGTYKMGVDFAIGQRGLLTYPGTLIPTPKALVDLSKKVGLYDKTPIEKTQDSWDNYKRSSSGLWFDTSISKDLEKREYDRAEAELLGYTASPIQNFVIDGLEGLVESIPQVAAIMANPAVGAALVISQSTQESYNELVDAGIDEDIAYEVSDVAGVIDGGLEFAESLLQKSLLKGSSKIQSSVVKSFRDKAIKFGQNKMVQFAGNILGENITELSQLGVDISGYNVATYLQNERDGGNRPYRGVEGEDVIETVRQTTATTMMFGAAGVSARKFSESKNKRKYKNETINKLVSTGLDEQVVNDTLRDVNTAKEFDVALETLWAPIEASGINPALLVADKKTGLSAVDRIATWVDESEGNQTALQTALDRGDKETLVTILDTASEIDDSIVTKFKLSEDKDTSDIAAIGEFLTGNYEETADDGVVIGETGYHELKYVQNVIKLGKQPLTEGQFIELSKNEELLNDLASFNGVIPVINSHTLSPTEKLKAYNTKVKMHNAFEALYDGSVTDEGLDEISQFLESKYGKEEGYRKLGEFVDGKATQADILNLLESEEASGKGSKLSKWLLRNSPRIMGWYNSGDRIELMSPGFRQRLRDYEFLKVKIHNKLASEPGYKVSAGLSRLVTDVKAKIKKLEKGKKQDLDVVRDLKEPLVKQDLKEILPSLEPEELQYLEEILPSLEPEEVQDLKETLPNLETEELQNLEDLLVRRELGEPREPGELQDLKDFLINHENIISSLEDVDWFAAAMASEQGEKEGMDTGEALTRVIKTTKEDYIININNLDLSPEEKRKYNLVDTSSKNPLSDEVYIKSAFDNILDTLTDEEEGNLRVRYTTKVKANQNESTKMDSFDLYTAVIREKVQSLSASKFFGLDKSGKPNSVDVLLGFDKHSNPLENLDGKAIDREGNLIDKEGITIDTGIEETKNKELFDKIDLELESLGAKDKQWLHKTLSNMMAEQSDDEAGWNKFNWWYRFLNLPKVGTITTAMKQYGDMMKIPFAMKAIGFRRRDAGASLMKAFTSQVKEHLRMRESELYDTSKGNKLTRGLKKVSNFANRVRVSDSIGKTMIDLGETSIDARALGIDRISVDVEHADAARRSSEYWTALRKDFNQISGTTKKQKALDVWKWTVQDFGMSAVRMADTLMKNIMTDTAMREITRGDISNEEVVNQISQYSGWSVSETKKAIEEIRKSEEQSQSEEYQNDPTKKVEPLSEKATMVFRIILDQIHPNSSLDRPDLYQGRLRFFMFLQTFAHKAKARIVKLGIENMNTALKLKQYDILAREKVAELEDILSIVHFETDEAKKEVEQTLKTYRNISKQASAEGVAAQNKAWKFAIEGVLWGLAGDTLVDVGVRWLQGTLDPDKDDLDFIETFTNELLGRVISLFTPVIELGDAWFSPWTRGLRGVVEDIFSVVTPDMLHVEKLFKENPADYILKLLPFSNTSKSIYHNLTN